MSLSKYPSPKINPLSTGINTVSTASSSTGSNTVSTASSSTGSNTVSTASSSTRSSTILTSSPSTGTNTISTASSLTGTNIVPIGSSSTHINSDSTPRTTTKSDAPLKSGTRLSLSFPAGLDKTGENTRIQPNVQNTKYTESKSIVNTLSPTSLEEGCKSIQSPPTKTELLYDISNEETNYMRLMLLVLRLGPRAVRYNFDFYVDRKKLCEKLKNEKEHMKDLLRRKILTKDQWSLLYPLQGRIPKSEHFDLTLMILLFREVLKVNPPSEGWDKYPKPNDTSESADLIRMRHHRNELVHNKKSTISNYDFKRTWKELKDAINRLTDKSFEYEMQHLLLQRLDRAQIDLDRELNGFHKEATQQKPLLVQTIQRWYTEDTCFIETNAAVSIKKAIERICLMNITGASGAGKSAIAHHTALKLKGNGYEIIPALSIKDVHDMFVPEKKQVFVLDDPFGTLKVDESEINNWQKLLAMSLTNLLENASTKLIITMRKHIINDKRICTLFSDLKESTEDNEKVNIQIVDISAEPFLLSVKEKRIIFEKHMLNSGKTTKCESSVTACNLSCFPLLCRMFATDHESRFDLCNFFKSPYPVLSKELNHFRSISDLKYLGLVLCVIYDNELDADIVENCDQNKNKDIIETFLDLCHVPKSESRQKILFDLDLLVGTYLVKVLTTYKFQHDFIFDTVVNSLPVSFHKAVIKYASSKFMRTRVRFAAMNYSEEEKESCVFLNDDCLGIWADRLVDDIEYGHFYDVFFNPCLQDRRYDMAFSSSLSQRADLEKFVCSKMKSEYHETLQNKRQLLEDLDDDILLPTDQYRYDLLYLIFMLLDEDECTPLHCIVARKLEETFKYLWTEILLTQTKKIFMSSVTFLLLSCFGGSVDITQQLIADGADINQSNTEGWTPVYAASYSGSYNLTEALADHGADINVMDKENSTPLIASSFNGHADIVKMLITKGAIVNTLDIYKWNAIYAASYSGHENVVRCLLANSASIEIPTNDGRTPVIAAATRGHRNVLSLLLEEGADVNRTTSMNRSALYEAASNGRHDVLQTLIKNKAEINKCDKNECSPLYAACHRGHIKVVKELVVHGAEKNKCSKFGWTPLFAASSMGHISVVDYLIQNGASVNQQDHDGWTPLYAATMSGHCGVAELLLESSAEMNICDNDDSSTTLIAASGKGYNDIVQLLLKYKPNIDATDNEGSTALYHASKMGHCDVVKSLTESGADVNKSNKEGKSPLFIASNNGSCEIVQTLLSNGAIIDQQDNYSITPLAIAIISRHQDVEKLLMEQMKEKKNN